MPAQKLEKLVFPEKLLQKNTGADALHKKLKDLHEKLKNLEQDGTDLKSVKPVSQELINNTLLLHKDKGVKAYVACCLVDILRLFAPDAPYNDAQIKDIFQFVLRQLTQNLKQSQSAFGATKGKGKSSASGSRITDIPYYTEYYYVLESLATIKSVCLIPNVEGAEGLLLEYVQGMLSIARPDISKTLLRFLQDIIVSLVEESDKMPEGVLDCLLGQVKGNKDHPELPVFTLATGVMTEAAQVFHRPLQVLMVDTYNEHTRSLDDDDISSLEDAHDLIVLLFEHCPRVLLQVFPQLEETLQHDSVQVRTLSTNTLSTIFGLAGKYNLSVGSSGSHVIYRSTWEAWLKRRTDKAVAVRIAWVNGAKAILTNHPELRRELEPALAEKLADVDERVRCAVCKLFGSLDYETAAHHVTAETMKALGERLLDRKPAVCEEAYRGLGRLFALAYPQIYAEDATAIEQFAWIPTKIFVSYCENDTPLTRQIIEQTTSEYLLPLPDPKTIDETAWTERLLLVAPASDNKAFASFMTLSNLAEPGTQPWEVYLQACTRYNGGVMDEQEKEITLMLDQICRYLSQSFPNRADVENDLKEFAKANEKMTYRHFESMLKVDSSIHDIYKATNDLLKRISQQQPGVLETFTKVCRRASLWVVNRSSIHTLLQRTGKSDFIGAKAVKLLRYVSKHRPAILKTHIAELQKTMSDKLSIASVEAGIQCLAQASFGNASLKLDSKTIDRAKKMCTGDNVRLAKYAARLLGQLRQTTACETIIQDVLDKLDGEETESYPACMATIAELARSASLVLHEQWSSVESAITRALLPREDGRFSIQQEEEEEDEPWIDFDELSALGRAKILALKVITNRCLFYPEGRPPKDEVLSHIHRLCSVVEHDGFLSSQLEEHGSLRGHLRLTAATALLKLAILADNEKEIKNSAFETVAYVVQDLYFQVREAFLIKLRKHLARRRNAPRWNMIPFLSAHDLDEELHELGRRLATDLLHGLDDKMRMERIERPFVRLLVLIAHHPDFAMREDAPSEHEDWIHAATYILSYVDIVANANNIAYLHYLASRLKTVADATYPGDRLYKISDLAQAIIQHKRKVEGWPAGAFGGKQHLPSGLFVAIDIDTQRQIARQTYLPEDYETWLFETSKKAAPRKPRVPKPKLEGMTKKSVPQKRKSRINGDSKPKRQKRENGDASEDEEDSEPEVVQPRQRAAGKRQVKSVQARKTEGGPADKQWSASGTEEESDGDDDTA
ncbi:Sister chromatid cohesion protein pds5 [Naganishia albida]|nr:Sister chromatid cohesion protein pds5 [Naganishia albida]